MQNMPLHRLMHILHIFCIFSAIFCIFVHVCCNFLHISHVEVMLKSHLPDVKLCEVIPAFQWKAGMRYITYILCYIQPWLYNMKHRVYNVLYKYTWYNCHHRLVDISCDITYEYHDNTGRSYRNKMVYSEGCVWPVCHLVTWNLGTPV